MFKLSSSNIACHPLKEVVWILSTRSDNNNIQCWSSLVVQWLRICLPMQGTWVWFLVRNSTCCGAHVPQILVPCPGAWELQLLRPEHLEPVPHSKGGHPNERSTHATKIAPAWLNYGKPTCSNEDPDQPKINKQTNKKVWQCFSI